MKTGLILGALVLFLGSAHARDPDLPPPERYGERETVGGSNWSGGDTFIAIALPIAVVLTLVLPHVFDGEYQDWPVYKFRLHLLSNVNKTGNLFIRFPTRIPCASY